jgi:hypothetical protein
MSLRLELPEFVLEELRRRAEREGSSMECVVAEAVIAYLGLSDPDKRARIHLQLSEKYLREADEFLAEGDFVQASEKAWGAAAQAVKMVASKRGLELRSHGELHKFIVNLTVETKDEEIRGLWRSEGMLHQNFYENWLPGEMVADNIEDVKELVRKLKSWEGFLSPFSGINA